MKECPICDSEDFVVEAIMVFGKVHYTLHCTKCNTDSTLTDDWRLEPCP